MKYFLLSLFMLFVSTSIISQNPTTIKFQLEKEKVVRVKVVSKQNIQNTMNGMTFKTEVNTNTSISQTLLLQEKDILHIEFKFDTIQNKTTSPMGNKETNSAKPAKKGDYLEQMYNRFSTSPIVARITTSGKFLGFDNYKSFRDNILIAMDSIPENKKGQIQFQVDMLLKESSIQSMIEPLFAYLPESPVKTGDEWETSYAVAGGGVSGMIFNTFTLGSIDEGIAQTTVKSELESIPSTDDKAPMSLAIKGNSTGSMSLNVTTGLLIKGNDQKHFEGIMTVKNQGNLMSIPIIIDTQTEVRSY